jgi:hypothetical protein
MPKIMVVKCRECGSPTEIGEEVIDAWQKMNERCRVQEMPSLVGGEIVCCDEKSCNDTARAKIEDAEQARRERVEELIASALAGVAFSVPREIIDSRPTDYARICRAVEKRKAQDGIP